MSLVLKDALTGIQAGTGFVSTRKCIIKYLYAYDIEREKERQETVGWTQGHNQSDGVSESTNTRQMEFKLSLRVKQKTREDIEGNVFQ